MDTIKDFYSVYTTVNQKFSYVVFRVEEKTHKLRIRTKLLGEKEEGFFGGEKHVVRLKHFPLWFPASPARKKINILRELWDELADFGFEMV